MPRLIALVLALAAALLLSASQASAGLLTWTIGVSKHEDGPYDEPLRSANIPPGETKNLYWEVRNLAAEKQNDMRFNDASSNPEAYGFKVTWLKGDRDITNKVEGSGYIFDIKPEKAKRFRAKVKATQQAEPMCLDGRAGYPGDYAYGSFNLNGDECPL